MHYPTTYTSPADKPKFDFLQTHNYLGEFKSEIDKARVRKNLGILDEYSYVWGNIRGDITSLSDLMAILNGLNKKQTNLANQINAINAIIVTDTGSEADAKITLKDLYREFLDLKIDVSHNAIELSKLVGNTGYTELLERIVAIESRLSALESNSGSTTQTDTLNSTLIPSLSTTSFTYTSDTSFTYTISAKYSVSGTKNVTASVVTSSDNNSVAYWLNGTLYIKGVGTATLTWSYTDSDGNQATLTKKFVVSLPTYYYMGYNTTYVNVLGVNSFKKTSLSGTWNSTNIPNSTNFTNGMYLWYCLPTGKSISITCAGLSAPPTKLSGTLTYDGIAYDIYFTGPLTNNNTEFVITTS